MNNQKLKLKKGASFNKYQNMKYLSINMAKDRQDPYNEEIQNFVEKI